MTKPRIIYTVVMSHPHSHLFEVSVAVEGVDGPELELLLPSWTPGSYMIREYARHVQEFSAMAGDAPLPWRKVAKDSWRIDTGGATALVASYKVYANELTVRTSHLDGSHGYFNGATLFMYLPGRMHEPHGLRIALPEGWKATTGLEPWMDDGPWTVDGTHSSSFIATDYDELIDCPVECGIHRLLTFEVDGIEHRIAIWGHGNEEEARLVADSKKIVEAQRDFFGGLPYRHYTFILHLTDGRGGGLEHRNSVSNMVDRWSFRPERRYERFLSLTAHEFFHVWNVKRIRPAPLGPFDYRSENYTRQLWVAEGITSYYDELLLVRGRQMTPERFLEKLAEEIATLEGQPGRHVQSLEQSSFDAWIKFYRPDENSENSSISYYLKGSLASLMLDMAIRRESRGEVSLDDLMRHLFARYPLSGPGIAEEGGILAALEHVVGSAEPFRPLFEQYIAGTAELDYDEGLATVGLRLVRNHRHNTPGGGAPAWLGLKARNEGTRLMVNSVNADGPAMQAGIYAGDELIAFEGWRIDADRLNERLAERVPGDTVALSLFRGDELHTISVILAAAPPDKYSLVALDERDELQERMYREWLGL